MGVFLYYAGLPHGQIWPNLLASLVCVGVAWWRIRARMIAHHLEQLAQAEAHHLALREHVTAAAVRPAARKPKTLVTEPVKEERP